MARKKKISQDEVAQVMDEVTGATAQDQVKAYAEKPKRDLSEANAANKDHAKFDKFKKGNK